MDEEAWTAPDVYLLTSGSQGSVAVPNHRLTFRDTGLELDNTDGAMVWGSDWSDLVEMAPTERSVLPDGTQGVVMVVIERARRRRHRFVLATDDPAATEDLIRRRASSHGLRTRSLRPAVSRLLVAAIVIAVAVTLTLLLLSAAHVIRF